MVGCDVLQLRHRGGWVLTCVEKQSCNVSLWHFIWWTPMLRSIWSFSLSHSTSIYYPFHTPHLTSSISSQLLSKSRTLCLLTQSLLIPKTNSWSISHNLNLPLILVNSISFLSTTSILQSSQLLCLSIWWEINLAERSITNILTNPLFLSQSLCSILSCSQTLTPVPLYISI